MTSRPLNWNSSHFPWFSCKWTFLHGLLTMKPIWFKKRLYFWKKKYTICLEVNVPCDISILVTLCQPNLRRCMTWGVVHLPWGQLIHHWIEKGEMFCDYQPMKCVASLPLSYYQENFGQSSGWTLWCLHILGKMFLHNDQSLWEIKPINICLG